MAAKKNFLGFVDTGRKIRRPPLVGMEFLHQRAMRAGDGLSTCARFQAKDLIGLLLRHFPASRRPPRVRIALRVFTTARLPAVRIWNP